MQGVFGLLAVLAILVALASLWLASETTKRVEDQARKLFETHLRGVKDRLADLDRSLDGVKRRQDGIETTIGELRDAHSHGANQLVAIASGLRSLTEALTSLDRSIPQRYRSRPKDVPGDQPPVQ